PGQAEPGQPGLAVDVPRHGDHDVLRHVLDAGGDIGVVLVTAQLLSRGRVRVVVERRAAGDEPRLRVAWGAEHPLEAAREGALGVVKAHVGRIEPATAVLAQRHDRSHLIDVAWLPERGHTPDLVLALADLEAEERREDRVEKTERVRKE